MIFTNEDKRVLVNCTLGKRLKSYFIDVAVMFPFFIIIMTIVAILFAEIARIQPQFDPYKYVNIAAAVLLFIIHPAIKDIPFKEGSLGNKIMHIEVVDMKTGKKPKKIKLFIRNIFKPTYFHFANSLNKNMHRSLFLHIVLVMASAGTQFPLVLFYN